MNNYWIDIRGKYKHGIVLHNYTHHPPGSPKLALTVGQKVELLSRSQNLDWYYGSTVYNSDDPNLRRKQSGIFPWSFVHLVDNMASGEMSLVEEISCVLREWLVLWKSLYLSDKKSFRALETRMRDLIQLRSKILSQTLPVDELKEVKHNATFTMDVGNNMLGLDLIVRDEQCNLIEPNHISATEMYNLHLKVTQEIKDKTNRNSHLYRSSRHFERSDPPLCHSIGVTLKGWISKAGSVEPPNLKYLYALYDYKQMKVFTEALVVSKSSYQNVRVLFTDLNRRDTDRERVYLVCYVVRIGSLHPDKEDKHTSSSSSSMGSATDVQRAYGVAALDITLFLNGKLEADDDQPYFMPFITCDKDNLENTLKRLISTLKDTSLQKSAGVHVSLKFLCGDNKVECCAAMTNTFVARKMGYPEIILPGDVRNDLYITLVNGEFKSSDKTIQVTVQVFHESRGILKDVVLTGAGAEPQSQYDSLVYHHEDKPRWAETFKLAISIEEFKASHLRITYRHRSSNESKKAEKLFAMSFIKLMQKNGTTLPDISHELLVYKIDHKKWDVCGLDTSYLSLPSSRSELAELGAKPSLHVAGFSLYSKDVMVIATNLCSTKLTQNVDLLGLLKWVDDPSRLDHSLKALLKLDGEEIVKFLQDVLDALFLILISEDTRESHKLVFECLLHIICLVLDTKYQHFQPVLDLYLEESFSATLVYENLIQILSSHIQRGSDKDLLMKTMKSLRYLIKIIARSRLLFSTLNEGRGEMEFEASLKELLTHLGALMLRKSEGSILVVQGACLKYLPDIVPDLLHVWSPVTVSAEFIKVVSNVQGTRLSEKRLKALIGVVHSQLFPLPQCRRVLLPPILHTVKQFLSASHEVQSRQELRNTRSFAKIGKVLGASFRNPKDDLTREVNLCVEILGDMMGLLWKSHTKEDIDDIMKIVLRTVIQSVIRMDRDRNSTVVGHLVAIMLSIFRHMTTSHYESYMTMLPSLADKRDCLTEILLVCKELVGHPVFPNDWTEMILLQSGILLKTMRHFSHTVRNYFAYPFESQAWSNWFHCACVFLTQPALQLENFSPEKKARILGTYRDMRLEGANEIYSMWFSLVGPSRVYFVPSLVGMFLEVSLIPEPEVRKTIIPIFFDMMQCEFYAVRDREGNFIKGNFYQFENEMISKLDSLIEGGLGDSEYRVMFSDILDGLCEENATVGKPGGAFVQTAARQMDALLEYRALVKDSNPEVRMRCTVRLLDFYSETTSKELYLRYVHKLVALHLVTEDYTEAAYTLKLHAQLLTWDNSQLPHILKSNRHPRCTTHKQLKETLYLEAIEYFDKGKMWEAAVLLCKELESVYDFDYSQLAALHRRMAEFYDSIKLILRPEPEYFRVGYYGRGFPPFLQNKVFVYRGKGYERLEDFSDRVLNLLPNAELMKTLSPPGDDIKESNAQYVQINKVEPIMSAEDQRRLADKPLSEQILSFYRSNFVREFKFSRPYRRSLPPSGGESPHLPAGHRASVGSTCSVGGNEFASLWLERTVVEISSPLPGILRWFPLISTKTFDVSPLKCAIETMESTNRSLKQLILSHKADAMLATHPLSAKLQGIMDAAVNGGIGNYEMAFFSNDYLARHPEDAADIACLKELIACQVPLLEVGLSIHEQRVPPDMEAFHKRLEECYKELRQAVERKYGKRTCDIQLDPEFNVKLRRHQSISSNNLISTPRSDQKSPSISSSVFGGTFKRDKKDKDKKRRSTKSESKCSLDGASGKRSAEWYTGDTESAQSASSGSTTIIELREELVSSRPLRSEVEREKRLSQELGPSTESALPPNLPAKNKEVVYSNMDEMRRGVPLFPENYVHHVPKSLPLLKMPLPNPTNEETPETSEESDASLPHNAPSKPPRIPPRNGDKSSPSSPQKEDENSPLASPLREVEIPEGKISDEGIPPVPPREGEKAPVTPPRNGGGSKRTPPPTPPRRVDVLREIFSQSGNYSREKPHANEEGEKISPSKNIEWEISEISTCGNNPSESFSHNFEVESLPLPPSEDVLREITPLLKYNGENFSENVREDSSPCKEGREFLPPEDNQEADFPLSPPDVEEGDEERAPTPPPKKPLIRMNF